MGVLSPETKENGVMIESTESRARYFRLDRYGSGETFMGSVELPKDQYTMILHKSPKDFCETPGTCGVWRTPGSYPRPFYSF